MNPQTEQHTNAQGRRRNEAAPAAAPHAPSTASGSGSGHDRGHHHEPHAPRHRDSEGGLNLKPSGRTHAPPASSLEGSQAGSGQTIGQISVENPVFSCRDVNVYYGHKHALKKVSIDVGRKQVLAMIGPSGCGKSTFLRCLNRMNDTISGARVTGSITLDG